MSSPYQHIVISYEISSLPEHNDRNFEDYGYWTFMGPPLYDSSRPGSIVSKLCSDKEQLDEVNQIESEFDIVWDEELSITSSRDIEDMIYEDPIERGMIIPSPYDANDEEWLNPFSSIVEKAPPDVIDGCHMQMAYYDEQLEN